MNYPEQNIQSKLNIHERQIDDGILRMRRGNKLVMLTGEPRVGSGEPPIHRSQNNYWTNYQVIINITGRYTIVDCITNY